MDLAGKEKPLLALLLLIILLIACNFAFVFSSGWSRLGWQVFGFGGLLGICWIAGLSFADIGLSKSHIGSGLTYGLMAISVVLAGFLIAYFVDPNLFRDNRYHNSLPAALYSALFILPLKIVIFEELAFRGIMPALLKGLGVELVTVIIVSSLLFGLWHILSAPKSDALSVIHSSNWMTLVGVFVITSAGGAVFYLLRYHSDSLISSILAHWFINGFAIVLASYSWMHQSLK